MSNSLLTDKIIKTRKFAYYLIHNKCSFRGISSFLGLVESHLSAFQFFRLHYRQIHLRYINNVKDMEDCIDLFPFGDNGSMDDLSWWSF